MLLSDGLNISDLIKDPVYHGSNINGTKIFFFHGTRKDLLPLIDKQGLKVEPKRPIFTVDPIYSLGYCRKSESYLRGLIASGNKLKLKEETDKLISKNVISEDDLQETKYMWWINKANKYYESEADIINEGMLLIFSWPATKMIEATESSIRYKKNDDNEFIEGAPSYWRTRQFFYNTETDFKQKLFSEIRLDKEFVDKSKELYSHTGKGKLTPVFWKNIVDTINLNVVRQPELVEDNFKLSYLSQIVESRFIKELRDLLIAVLKNRGLKVYWRRNQEYLEDPRWDLSKSEINEKISNLTNNDYPFAEWKNYVNNKLSVIHDLAK